MIIKMKQFLKLFTVMVLLGFSKPVKAQLGLEVHWTMFLSYDTLTSTYNVYGISDTSSSGPFGWAIASTQITVLVPDSLPNVPLSITSVQFGGWSDVVANYNCPNGGGFDYHSISTISAPTQHIYKDSVIKMFSFTLPQGCRNFVRLFRNVPETYTFGTSVAAVPADNPDPCAIFNDFTNSIGNGNVIGGEAFGQTIDNYGWICNIGLAPLGIKFTDITGENVECENRIHLQSYEEDNLKLYRLFASENGIDYKEVDVLLPTGGGSQYTFKHNSKTNFTFYKVIAEDLTGHFSSSNIIRLVNTCIGGSTVNLYPNPAASEITFELNATEAVQDAKYTLQIIDVLGNIVSEKVETSSNKVFTTKFDISNLPNGNYLLRYQVGNYKTSGIIKFNKLAK